MQQWHRWVSNFLKYLRGSQLLLLIKRVPLLQESSLVNMVVHRLLLNYITRPQFSVNTSSSILFSEGNQPGVLRRVSSAAGITLLHTLLWFKSLCGVIIVYSLICLNFTLLNFFWKWHFFNGFHLSLFLVKYRFAILKNMFFFSNFKHNSNLQQAWCCFPSII